MKMPSQASLPCFIPSSYAQHRFLHALEESSSLDNVYGFSRALFPMTSDIYHSDADEEQTLSKGNSNSVQVHIGVPNGSR